MEFDKFLETKPKYKNFVILKEKGNRNEIERISKQYGKKTKAYILLWNTETENSSKHQIYVSNWGYTIMWNRRRVNLKNFKI